MLFRKNKKNSWWQLACNEPWKFYLTSLYIIGFCVLNSNLNIGKLQLFNGQRFHGVTCSHLPSNLTVFGRWRYVACGRHQHVSNSGAVTAVPFQRLCQRRPINASFPSRATKDATGGSFSEKPFPGSIAPVIKLMLLADAAGPAAVIAVKSNRLVMQFGKILRWPHFGSAFHDADRVSS